MIYKRILFPILVSVSFVATACPEPVEIPVEMICEKTCDDVFPRCDGNKRIATDLSLDSDACECVSMETTTDCAAGGQLCSAGACIDDPAVCDPNPCATPPENNCMGDTFVSWTMDPGACTNNAGAAECDYSGSKNPDVDCAADGKVCSPTGCVDPDPTCDNYCDTIMRNCMGEDAQFGERTECMDYCSNVGKWEMGTKGDTDGNTLACRIYHGNTPAAGDPATHCVHAGPTGGNVCGTWCDNYCDLSFEHCTDGNAHGYTDTNDCVTKCSAFGVDGDIADVTGDTVQCRIYHAGAPAAADAATHCPHAGEAPTSQCVDASAFVFDATPPDQYTIVDAMGMPAVSTALISSSAAYNMGSPFVPPMFLDELVANLTAMHAALDDDLTGAGLTPCSMTTMTNGLVSCLGQEVAPGVTVASLLVPDYLVLNTSSPAGFPNGRRLQDRVMDITLAILLLDMGAHGAPTFFDLDPNTAGEQPLNPASNDKGGAFLPAFPYLHQPHTP